LVKEKRTSWTGVHNNLALIHLRNVKQGDLIFFYHTQDEKQIVGVMKALRDAYPNDNLPLEKSREVAVEVEPVEKLKAPVSLQKLKQDKRFKDFSLIKISRLSVMPVTDEQWKLISSMTTND